MYVPIHNNDNNIQCTVSLTGSDVQSCLPDPGALNSFCLLFVSCCFPFFLFFSCEPSLATGALNSCTPTFLRFKTYLYYGIAMVKSMEF